MVKREEDVRNAQATSIFQKRPPIKLGIPVEQFLQLVNCLNNRHPYNILHGVLGSLTLLIALKLLKAIITTASTTTSIIALRSNEWAKNGSATNNIAVYYVNWFLFIRIFKNVREYARNEAVVLCTEYSVHFKLKFLEI